jgi:hypothetical protein
MDMCGTELNRAGIKNSTALAGLDATYAGISIWNYIAQTYGESVIPQMLYIAHTSRSIESAFLYSLGTSLKAFTKDWLNYYTAQYQKRQCAGRCS